MGLEKKIHVASTPCYTFLRGVACTAPAWHDAREKVVVEFNGFFGTIHRFLHHSQSSPGASGAYTGIEPYVESAVPPTCVALGPCAPKLDFEQAS